jgi:membrane associated rhomboid family serine protease
MDLFCPRCSSPLARDDRVSGAAWACREGHGHTVGMGPLRLLLDHGIASNLWRQSASAIPSHRTCPSCAKIMAAVKAPGENGVIDIEMCRRCHVAWLDEGEWDSLPLRPRLPSGESPVRELPERAAEVMARAQLERVKTEQPAKPAVWWHWLLGFLGLPVRADGRPVVFAPVTWIIGLAMVVATVAGYVVGLDEAVASYGLIPADPGRLGGATLITSFLLHGGVVHLLGNLYFLIVVGSAVEHRVGSRRTLVVLAASMAIAALTHMALDPRPDVPLVGASGAIAGLIALFAFAFSKVPFRIFVFLLLPPVIRWIRVSAATLGVIFLAYNVIGAWYQLGGWSSVSSLAHLGGAGAGMIFWLAWRTELKTARRVARVTAGRPLVNS